MYARSSVSHSRSRCSWLIWIAGAAALLFLLMVIGINNSSVLRSRPGQAGTGCSFLLARTASRRP